MREYANGTNQQSYGSIFIRYWRNSDIDIMESGFDISPDQIKKKLLILAVTSKSGWKNFTESLLDPRRSFELTCGTIVG